jgi:two-component system chemotaxis response regulator CheB
MARDIIVIGASAGGVEALRQLVGDFPADWQAAVFVVIHLPAGGESMLPVILERSGPLPARHPADGMKIVPGTVFVAPPNHHMILDDGHVRLTRGPRQNRHAPAGGPARGGLGGGRHGSGPSVSRAGADRSAQGSVPGSGEP